jgi:hypothetical protein
MAKEKGIWRTGKQGRLMMKKGEKTEVFLYAHKTKMDSLVLFVLRVIGLA